MAAVESLKPARIAGCGGLHSRDDAMTAGERGADYVMFGEHRSRRPRPSFEAIVERIEWWSELFTDSLRRICRRRSARSAPLSAAGADFVAVGDGLWDDPRGVAAALAEAAAAACRAGARRHERQRVRSSLRF